MSKKLTTSEFVSLCTTKHEGKYDYRLVTYAGQASKVEIVCPVHGTFWQVADSHRRGCGCPDCHSVSRKTGKVAAKAVHLNCPLHGSYSLRTDMYEAGKGCQECGREVGYAKMRLSEDSFIERCLAVHNGTYTYENIEYAGNKLGVDVTCRIHGIFHQNAGWHLRGHGCPKCKKCGYNQSKHGYLYILTSGRTTKVGITNRSPKVRVTEIAHSGGPAFDIKLAVYFDDGHLAKNLESIAHKWLATHWEQVSEKFDGSTECFLDVDLKALTDFIVPLASSDVNNHATA